MTIVVGLKLSNRNSIQSNCRDTNKTGISNQSKENVETVRNWTWNSLSRLVTKQTKLALRPAKSQISLGTRTVWSVFAWRNIGSSATHWAHCEVSDQIGRMPMLIWVFAVRTDHFVGFVMRWLIYWKRGSVINAGTVVVIRSSVSIAAWDELAFCSHPHNFKDFIHIFISSIIVIINAIYFPTDFPFVLIHLSDVCVFQTCK